MPALRPEGVEGESGWVPAVLGGGRGLCEGGGMGAGVGVFEPPARCQKRSWGWFPRGRSCTPSCAPRSWSDLSPAEKASGGGHGVTGSRAGGEQASSKGEGTVKGYSSREVSRSAKERNKGWLVSIKNHGNISNRTFHSECRIRSRFSSQNHHRLSDKPQDSG